MPESTLYRISWGDHSIEIRGRADSVAFAKAKSLDVPMTVNLDSVRGNHISLTFHKGNLESFISHKREAKPIDESIKILSIYLNEELTSVIRKKSPVYQIPIAQEKQVEDTLRFSKPQSLSVSKSLEGEVK